MRNEQEKQCLQLYGYGESGTGHFALKTFFISTPMTLRVREKQASCQEAQGNETTLNE